MPTTGRYEQIDGIPVVRFERTFPHLDSADKAARDAAGWEDCSNGWTRWPTAGRRGARRRARAGRRITLRTAARIARHSADSGVT
jgi:hypothetical protein